MNRSAMQERVFQLMQQAEDIENEIDELQGELYNIENEMDELQKKANLDNGEDK